ncbi:MAG: GTP-binding protein [Anaerovoracaceae bacterium]
METQIYLFTGFLESGKTTLIKEVVKDPDFLEEGVTILLQCEEGENTYDDVFLKRYNMVKIVVGSPDELNKTLWEKCEKKYAPAQIIIEYNGTWTMETLWKNEFPGDWEVGGIYSTVDASTAEMYLLNMRKLFMEQLKESNLIIFNRSTEDTQRLKFRRNLKAMNPEVQVAFEKVDGTMYQNQEEEMPFDYSGNKVEIPDMDYGLWYLDAMEHYERYMGKTISFSARFCESTQEGEEYFIPGRHIMTCCEDDIQFLGYLCKYKGKAKYNHGDWVKVTVLFDFGCLEDGNEPGPMLQLKEIAKGEKPEQELVFFT